VEIEARSLAEHRAYLQQLEEAMRRDALIPAGGHGPARTELEISLTAGQSFAVLQSLAGQKSSMLSTLLRQWTRLTGEKLADNRPAVWRSARWCRPSRRANPSPPCRSGWCCMSGG
jgi:recombinational DNA repair ATPase RecF